MHDIAVIGAGPVGIFSVFAFGMQGLKCVLVDALDRLGGQCAALYPQKMIYDIPAYPAITGHELTQQLIDQAIVFEPEIMLNSVVDEIIAQDNHFDLAIKKGDKTEHIKARSVVLALGAGVFKPVRVEIENIPEFEGKNVFYFINDLNKFYGKNVAIVGGGDSAVDWALEVAAVANKVYLVHRREYIKAHPASWQKVLGHSKIEVKIPYQLSKIEKNGDAFAGVHISDGDENSQFLEIDYLLPCFGLKSDIGFLNAWNLDMHSHKIVVDPTTMCTSKPGVYAIGDCVYYNNKRKLILTGFAEAANCASHLFTYLYPDRAARVGHSTSLGVPKRG